MTTQALAWQKSQTPTELQPMLQELGRFYDIREDGSGLPLVFSKTGDAGRCEVSLQDGQALLRYAGQAQAGRAMGALLSGLVTAETPYAESTPFETFGIMLDCSRNAVMTVEHVQQWMRQLALLGYSMVMLYTEDTYELPGEPWFGYQRGAYSAAELKQMDRYAEQLGLEVVPCIQTLGHLEKILRHGAYQEVKDTSSVMMVGEDATYTLIEKMVAHWKSVCRTDRIHLGMDETHDLGRGRYLDRHGYRPAFDLFNEHLARVVDICRNHGLTPIIWSDMYFRLGCESGSYYDPATVIPDRVVKKIPGEVTLVYWDYYHSDKAFYLDWIQRHRDLGKEPMVGSGVWTWNKYWYDHRTTTQNAGPCIEACCERKVKELFFTMWGDNGAYCDHDSAFAGMLFCADKAYGHAEPQASLLEKRFAAVCGGSYAAHILASEMHAGDALPSPRMWADPIFETPLRNWAEDDPARMAEAAAGFANLAARLKPHANSQETGNLMYAWATVNAVAERYQLAADLLKAYRNGNRQDLESIKNRIGSVAGAVLVMESAFREMWMSHNKPQGIETIQARFGMLQARYRELEARLADYLKGRIGEIAELDDNCPPA